MPKQKKKKTDLAEQDQILRKVEEILSTAKKSLSENELLAEMNLPKEKSDLLHKALSFLQKKGIVVKHKKKYFLLSQPQEIAVGTLRMHPRGFGFLECDDQLKFPQDIFIPKHFTKKAVDGDRVEVLVQDDHTSVKGPEGKVISILERSRTHVAGIIRDIDEFQQKIAYVPLLGKNRKIVVTEPREEDLKIGDRVILKIDEWGDDQTETLCSLSHKIGHISDPSCDVEAAIEEYEIRKDFPSRVLEEVKQFGQQVGKNDLSGRVDLTKSSCFTIDPDTAKDFDDAISLEKTKEGYFLGVHIADVSHYVQPGTAIDEEAFLRCNSTYLLGKCVPMLPRELSDNLCSLKPDVKRLTISTFMHFSLSGDLLSYEIKRSFIQSSKRFTYKEAKEVLDGKTKSPFLPHLKLMTELCALLKQKRYERGSIEFALPELYLHCDDKGNPLKLESIPYDITHQMIEEFMLKTNELIATHLTEKGKNLSYRIHEEPTEENIRDFAFIANAFGFEVSDNPTVSELQNLFEKAFKTPHGPHLATNYIRRLRLAIYSPNNIGHYGLKLSHYCHFTSPIRRYIDLVIHRILFDGDDDGHELQKISDRCSEQERISAKAEGAVILIKKLRLLTSWQKQEPDRTYQAIVTKIKNFGLTFEVLDLLIEGFIPIHQMDHDFFILTENGTCLEGVHHNYRYQAGDKIEVALKNVDLILLDSEWYILPEDSPPSKEVKKKFSPKRAKKEKKTKSLKKAQTKDVFKKKRRKR